MSDSESPEFSTLLLQHAKGRAHDEATRKLAQLVTAVKETGKGGSITVQIKVVPDKKIDGVVKIEDKVTASIPFDQSTSMWFTDDNGQLHRNDPKQAPLWDTEPSNSTAGK
ncbi:hypothetical protein QLQ75_gp44 [Gordonia phage Santhid]|uniref:Uncharacterized protein n=1 Tax=Gordonia phage Santhid TaxID=2927281 RepID=A0AAE9GLT7_9CAUD|nr:hypothetical protein QLQ75_gp44 [Gordonia phage Santhid]UOK18038.1 hypothetical protein SEA_SANTHID_44 [Gordonia phage Santhid]